MIGGSSPEELSEGARDERSERTYTALGSVLLVVLVIVVILLLWRTCGTTTGDGDSGGGGGVITDVPPLETVEGAVAIWLRPEASLQAVLERNELAGADTISLGDGTYVVTVTSDAERVIERLKSDPDLLDAGFLYSEE